MTTSLGEIRETAPVLYQEIGGKRVTVEGRFILRDEATVAFKVARYNPNHALVIDPTPACAVSIGGSGPDLGHGIAVDSAGNAYVTGHTDSTEATFPVTVGPDLTFNGTYSSDSDAFVAKIANDVQGSVAVGGAPVVGTRVQLKNLATSVKTKNTISATGTYQVDPVASASYSITIGTFVVGSPASVSGNLTVQGAPSVGTKVNLKNKTTGAVLKTTTDASGNFSFVGAAPGKCKITISPVPVP